MRTIVSLLVLWGFIFNAACQANSVEASLPLEVTSSPFTEPSSTAVPVSPTEGDIQMTASPPTPADSTAHQLVEQARNDLAQTLGIAADQITVSSTQAVTWPDSSLGCPRPGMVYTQVLTPGYLILLEANGRTYEYHANSDVYVFFCENPSPPVPGGPGDR